MLLSLFALFAMSCTDTPQPSASYEKESFHFQRQCVRKLFRAGDGKIINISATLFLQSVSDISNVCRWRGIECDTNGFMKTLVLIQGILGRANAVNVHWLPPTLQFVRISHASMLADLQTARLPRDIRYFSMLQNDAILGEKLDFRRLPKKMEELILAPVHLHGPVFLTELPKTMHLVHLMTKKIAGSIFVDNAAIPDGLMSFYIALTEGKNRSPYSSVVPAEQVDSRVSLGRGLLDIDQISRYNQMMHAKTSNLIDTYVQALHGF